MIFKWPASKKWQGQVTVVSNIPPPQTWFSFSSIRQFAESSMPRRGNQPM
jgi:hypothetical protein